MDGRNRYYADWGEVGKKALPEATKILARVLTYIMSAIVHSIAPSTSIEPASANAYQHCPGSQPMGQCLTIDAATPLMVEVPVVPSVFRGMLPWATVARKCLAGASYG